MEGTPPPMHTSPRARKGFTLIELSMSLAVMAMLMLGLSGAVIVSAHAIPTLTETGLADQEVIDGLTQFRTDLKSSATVMYRADLTGWTMTLTIKPTGAKGEPGTVVYVYNKAGMTLGRKVDARKSVITMSGLQLFLININQANAKATSVYAMLAAEKTIQRIFEIHALLPNKPGAL